MILKKCVNGTEQDCKQWSEDDLLSVFENEEALERVVWNGLKMWHIIFLSISGAMCLVILLCCCVKFRIPRTKQEIEADYIRRKILRKFRRKLKAIQNQELDEMDLKKALDKIRAELKSDTDSLAQSEAGLSAATLSSTGLAGGAPGTANAAGGTYRRGSQIQIDISLEELRAQTQGWGARFCRALSHTFLCKRTKSSDMIALTVDAEGQTEIKVPEGAFARKDSKPKPGKSTDENETVNKKEDMKVRKQGKDNTNEQEKEKQKKVKKQDEPKEKESNKKPKDSEDPKKKKEKEDTKKKAKKGEDPKPEEDQPQPGPSGSTTGITSLSPPQKEDKGKDKKQKEKEKKALKKEKEREEKERQKAEKAQLKIENEKAKAAEKEKARLEKAKEKEEKKKKDAEKKDPSTK